MYDDTATLIAYGERTYDTYGNETIETIETEVFVQPRSVYASEFYAAAQNGLKPTITLFIANRYDYAGQKALTYQGRNFGVIRTDTRGQRDGISLICEERPNDD